MKAAQTVLACWLAAAGAACNGETDTTAAGGAGAGGTGTAEGAGGTGGGPGGTGGTAGAGGGAAGSGAVSTEGRVLYTEFGAGLQLVNENRFSWTPASPVASPITTTPSTGGTANDSNDYAGGDHWRLDGTDSATGFVFSPTSPSLWGTDSPSRPSRSHEVQLLMSISGRLGAGDPFLSPFEVHELSLVSEIAGPPGTGITTALKHRFKAATGYHVPDQAPFIVFPGTEATGMYYVRYWFKLLPGFYDTFGSWYGLTENKNRDDNNRAGVSLASDGVGYRQLKLVVDSMQGGTASSLTSPGTWCAGYGTHYFDPFCPFNYPFQYSPEIGEDTWYMLEFATRGDNDGAQGGFAWAALDGVEFALYTGQTIFDGGSMQWWGIFMTMFYGNFTGDNAGTLVTGMELWDRFPADAAPHAGVGG